MEFDAYGASLPLEDVAGVARAVEELGFSGLWFTESKRPPYLGCAVAGEVTDALTIGTAIAVAFPRSPMITAQTAWELARATRGRFSLGLGTQVKAHIERRFSMSYEHPAAKLRDYVLAMRAIFRAFQGEERLRYEGEFYSFSLLTDFFSPGPSEYPDIPISVAGVNVGMARLAGDVFDGFHVHPFHSPRYLDERILPAIAEGAAAAGRTAADVEIICPVFTIVGDDEEQTTARESVRRQLAFYGSTRTYAPVFELHGWADASAELHQLMASGDTAAMSGVITDEMLDEYAVTASWDDLPDRLLARYQGRADRIFTYQPAADWLRSPATTERWREVAAQVRAGGGRSA